MMQKRNRAVGLTLWGVILLIWTTSASLRAQDDKPTVVVSLYFVGETVACPPDGYHPTRTCDPIAFGDLEDLARMTIPVQQSIPPEGLRLGQNLLNSIEAYATACPATAPCMDPQMRYSVVMAFEVSGIADVGGHAISLRRESPGNSEILALFVSGTLSDQGRWIGQQRADAFLPAYGVRWVLQVGEWTWVLRTEP